MKLKSALVAVAALIVLPLSVAQAESFYVAAEKTDLTLRVYTPTDQSDGDAEGYQLRLGWQAHENFGLELIGGTVEVDGGDDLGYAGVLLRPGTQLFSWLRASGIAGLYTGDIEIDGFSWGFGLELTLSENFSVTADWIHIGDDDDGADSGLRLETLNLGLKFGFGGGDDD